MSAALLLGALFGLGLCLVLAGFLGVALPETGKRTLPRSPRLALVVAGGLVAFVVTRWPVAVPAGAALGWFAPDLVGARRRRREALARTKAVAAITEMLRDTTSAGLGLAEALRATARVAPPALAAELQALERRASREPLPVALRTFAAEVDDPLCDLVVASLLFAERRSGSLEGVLTSLAATAREEAALRARVDAGRAGLGASAAVVAATTAVLVAFFCLARRDYFAPYGSLLGQGVLCLIGGCFAASFAWLSRLGRADAPPRILGPSEVSP